jgi:mannose-6-phosphate isomerase-like protein (cupin superfamily)
MSETSVQDMISKAPAAEAPEVHNLQELAINNQLYRKVVETTINAQIVVMSVRDTVPAEVHLFSTQIVTIARGAATITIDNDAITVSTGDTIMIPAGAMHKIFNRSHPQALKLITIYSPPTHEPDDNKEN